jgi:F-type H+-transporting ATPase subunit b
MENIVTSFGIQPVLLIAQVVNFLIVLYLLKRFAFGPILKVLKDRRKTVEESIKNAEETEKLLAQTEEREKEILKKAQSQAQEIIADARTQAATLQQEADEATKSRVERMLEDAQRKIEEQTLLAEKQLAKQVMKLSVDVLEKSLKGFFTDKEQKEVVAKATKRIRI